MRMRTRKSFASDLIESRWDEATARRVLAGWRASGQSLSGFARERGLIVQRLSWWRKRLGVGKRARGDQAVATLAFVPGIPMVSGGRHVSVRLPGGVEVEAASVEALPASWIATLLRELQAAT